MHIKNKVAALFIGLLLGYFCVVGLTYIFQSKLLYHPAPELKTPADYGLLNTQEIFLTTADNVKIQTWVHRASPGKPYVIFFHGNAHHLGNRKDKFIELINLGYGFIAPAWRGFSQSEGVPTKEGLYTDARTAVHYLQQLGVKTQDIILIGESLGSNMAIQMAMEYPVKGVFLIAPFTSVADRGKEIHWYLPVKLLLKDNFDNFRHIHKIHTPVLIVHGDKDEVTPHSHSEKLIQQAIEPKKLIIYPGKNHNDFDNKEIFTEMAAYFFE